MTRKKIMFVGLGQLGSQVLDMFLRLPHEHSYLVAGRNLEALQTRANLASLVATQLDFYPKVECTYLDANDIERTAQTIATFKPDIIFTSVTRQSWWVITTLPKPLFDRLNLSHVGPWLPMHLTLIYKLMQAVRQTGLKIDVINGSYPDVTNAVLSKAGLAPLIGIGNVSNAIPALRSAMAFKLNQPVEKVQVRLFAHHYLSHRISKSGDTGGAPFHLSVLVDGEDCSHLVDMDKAFDLLPTKFKRSGGLAGMPMTAASAVAVLDAIANEKTKIVHAPGPHGLPGGYPVLIDKDKIEVWLPPALTLADAVRINEEGQRYDGIDAIDEAGTAFFSEPEMAIMEEMLGYSRRNMALVETEDCANEITRRYAEFVKKATGQALPVT